MEREKVKDLTTGNPIKLMLLYSVPVLLGNVFQQIYNFADTIIVGQKLGENSLAAVGCTGGMYFLVNGFVVGITSGFAVHVSQRFGARDYDGMRNSIFNAVFLWIAFTVLVTAVAVVFSGPLLRLIDTPDSIMGEAQTYIVTIYAGIFAPMLYNAAACILRAVGDSKTPLYFLVISAVLNIGLDLLFIVKFDMGVFGAAVATVIAQAVSGILCIVHMHKKFEMLHIRKCDMRLDGRVIGIHCKIGLPMAFQFSITAIGTIVMQGAINAFGEAKIAAFTAASKVEQLVMQMAGASGVTIANFAGQNMGACKYDRIRKGVWQWALITAASAVLGALIAVMFGRPLCGLFIKNKTVETMDAAMMYLNTVTRYFIPLFLIFVFRNALQGMGKPFMPLMAGVFELTARSISACTLPKLFGFKGVCMINPSAWLAASIPLLITFIVVMHRFKKKGYFEKNKES